MRWTRFLTNVFASLVLTLTAACSTAPPSIFRTFDLDWGNSVSTDANQRVIINMKTHASSRPGRVNPERIVCAEPSPDVASVVASSFGFGLNILGKANTALSGSQGTALAQLAERTITVQLLRDQMYQACQAYANGAISGTEYSLLMSRNNDAMVTLMLGESAARLVGRKLATASVDSESNATATMPDIVKAATEMVKKQQEAEKANKDAVSAASEKSAADTIVQTTTETTSEEGKENAEQNADDAKDKKEETQQIADTKNEEAKDAAEKLVSVVTGASTFAATDAGGFADGPPTLNKYAVGLAEQLVELQENFLGQGATGHLIAACAVELGNIDAPVDLEMLAKTNNVSVSMAWAPSAGPVLNKPKRENAEKEPEESEQEETAKKPSGPELHGPTTKTKAISSNYYYLPGEAYSDDGYAALAYSLAELKEQRAGLLGKWGRKSMTEDRLRTMVALEDRERASFLAHTCQSVLPLLLKEDRRALLMRDALNFLVEVERQRAKHRVAALSGSPDQVSDVPDTISVSRLVADYVRCDGKSEDHLIEECRIEVLAQLVEQTGVEVDAPSNETSADPLSGSHVAQIAVYDTKALLDANWPKLQAALGSHLSGKTRHLKDVTVGGVKKISLRIGPFENQTDADAFCANVKPKISLAPLEADCVPAPK